MQKLGIDISVWQKGFNFDKAKEEGVEFVILRGAYSTSEDKCFDGFYKQCKEKVIKEVIDLYKGKIPEPYYSRLKTAMYNYKVEIND